MELFEFHLTGSKKLLKIAQDLNIKAISIHSLNRECESVKLEHMTSFTRYFDDANKAVSFSGALKRRFEEAGVVIHRVKIETPVFYNHYAHRTKYLECHFLASDFEYPLSRNVDKPKILALDRCYDAEKFPQFESIYADHDVERCIYDNNPQLDNKWLSQWPQYVV